MDLDTNTNKLEDIPLLLDTPTTKEPKGIDWKYVISEIK